MMALRRPLLRGRGDMEEHDGEDNEEDNGEDGDEGVSDADECST